MIPWRCGRIRRVRFSLSMKRTRISRIASRVRRFLPGSNLSQEARHDGFTFFFVTQVGGDLDIFIRGRVGKHYHLKRPWCLERSTLFQWENCRNPNSKTDIADAQTDSLTGIDGMKGSLQCFQNGRYP